MEKRQQIRTSCRIHRDQLTQEQVSLWSNEICSKLQEFPPVQQTETIFFYYPLGREVDLRSLANWARLQGKQLAYPRTEGDMIQFYPIQEATRFREGCFHVMEPEGDRPIHCRDPLILVPGVAFDKNKNRLGYGKGYYDRFLATVPQAVTIGIAYQCQVVDCVYPHDHDISMKYLVTEQGIW